MTLNGAPSAWEGAEQAARQVDAQGGGGGGGSGGGAPPAIVDQKALDAAMRKRAASAQGNRWENMLGAGARSNQNVRSSQSFNSLSADDILRGGIPGVWAAAAAAAAAVQASRAADGMPLPAGRRRGASYSSMI